jgi:tetratricopeptide (TPR) repeat protein/DNA-binding MarR family transcriptional regulator
MRFLKGPTVNERVLLHLGDYSKFIEHFVVPFPVTQDGIAEAVDIERCNVVRAIKNLKERELVFETKARVENSDRRRKVYFLTEKGSMELSKLNNRKYYNDAVYSKVPIPIDFVDRRNELRKMNTWKKSNSTILIVQGPLGIGKSSLVSKFLMSSGKQNLVFWHTFKETDTVRDILGTFGDFLYLNDNSILRYYLLSNRKINEKEILKILKINLSNVILTLDNCEKMSKEVSSFVDQVLAALDRMNDVKIILIIEKSSELPLKGLSKQDPTRLVLGGLERRDVEQLLKDKTYSDNIYEITKGHPLFLKLVSEGSDFHGNIETYLKDFIKKELTKEEKKLMEVASLYRHPFKAKSLFLEPGLDYEVMIRLTGKFLLTEITNDFYMVHELIKGHFISSLSEARGKNLHKKIAEHYMEDGGTEDVIEAIYHYGAAQKYKNAADVAISHGIPLIEKGCYSEFETALDGIEEEMLDELRLAEILILKGHLQRVRGHWDNALGYYQSANRIFEKQNLTEKCADMIRMGGNVYRDRGDYTKALENYALALESLSDSEVVVKIYDDIGTVKLRKGEFDEAEKDIMKGLRIAQKAADEKQVALNTHTLGNYHLCRGEWEKAKQTYRDCAEIFEKVQNLRMLATCNNNIAITYYKTGDVKKAVDYWKKSLSISEKIGDINVMMSYVNLGFITYKRGEWDQTEEYCKKALDISEVVDNNLASATAYSILGHIGVNRRNYPDCVDYYKKALNCREKEGDKSKIISSKNDLANAYSIERKSIEAESCANEALKMATDLGNKEELARAHLCLGYCMIQLNMMNDGKDNFREALKLSNQINHKSLKGKIYRGIGELYIEEKEYLAAEMHLNESVQIFEELEERIDLALSLIQLSRSYKGSGSEDPAPYHEKGIEILRDLGAGKAITGI